MTEQHEYDDVMQSLAKLLQVAADLHEIKQRMKAGLQIASAQLVAAPQPQVHDDTFVLGFVASKREIHERDGEPGWLYVVSADKPDSEAGK